MCGNAFPFVEKFVTLPAKTSNDDGSVISTSMNNDQQQLERLFGGNPHLKATLEQTCDFGGSHPATKETQPIFGDKQSLLRHVVQRAQSLGTWIERIEEHVKEMIGNGQENDVFISLDGQHAVKLNNFALLPDSATSLNGFFGEIDTNVRWISYFCTQNVHQSCTSSQDKKNYYFIFYIQERPYCH